MKPLKAHKYEEARITYPCDLQPKLNGLRAIYQNGSFFSGDFERWNDPVVRHLVTQLQSRFDNRIILDGELYVHGWLLQHINSAIAVTRLQPNDKTHLVQYHVFDRVHFAQTFRERTTDVFTTLLGSRLPSIIPVRPIRVYDRATADRTYAQFVEQGYEGVMYRLGDCPYTRPNQEGTPPENPRARFLSDQNNRVWHMIKRKDWHDDEFRIVRFQEGEETDKGSKQVGCVGAVICINSQGIEFAVGSFEGYSLDDLRYMWEHQDKFIGRDATIKYLTLTEDGVPFNARLIAIRN